MKPIQAAIEEAGGPSKVAIALNVSVQAVCFWRDEKRRFPEEHGAALECLAPVSGRRWLIWPWDWHRIWPELINADGAPAVPQEVADAGQGA